MKKILSAVLALVLILLSFAGCKNKAQTEEKHKEPITASEKKVVIMVKPDSVYPEEYKAATELLAEYQDSIIVQKYDESTIKKTNETDLLYYSAQWAGDESVGAIVFDRAGVYTSQAIDIAKSVNPDILIAAIEPETSYTDLASSCDFVLTADWNDYCEEIVKTAKDMGAENFLFISSNRQLQNPLYYQIKEYITDECDDNDIKFVFETSTDSAYNDISHVKSSYEQLIKSLVDGGSVNENTVVFSTDSLVQTKIAEITEELGLMYISPSFPSAYSGAAENCDAALPSKIKDTDTYLQSLKKEMTDVKGRYAFYNYSLATVLLRGAVYTMFDLLNGTITQDDLNERVILRLTETANYSKFKATKALSGGNIWQAYCPGFTTLENIKLEEEK